MGKNKVKTSDSNEDYGRVIKSLGQQQFEVQLTGGRGVRTCRLRGSLSRKQVRIEHGDIVRLCMGIPATKKAYIVKRYSPQEKKKLEEYGQLLPDDFSFSM